MSKRFLAASLVLSAICVLGGLALLDGRIALPRPGGFGGVGGAGGGGAATEATPGQSTGASAGRDGGARAGTGDSTAARAPDTGRPPAGGVWRCTDARGRTSYSDQPCADGRARAVDTRDALRGWDGERDIAESRRHDAIRQAVNAPPLALPPTASTGTPLTGTHASPDTDGLCASVNGQIAYLNARAGQPLQGWEQDGIRADLRALRDERSRLGCRTLD